MPQRRMLIIVNVKHQAPQSNGAMKKQLLLCKRLFAEGSAFAERQDPISCGIAISLFQDSVEMFLLTLIEKQDIPVKEDRTPFNKYIELLQSNKVALLDTVMLHDLNTARVSFKHHGNLPDPGEATKFKTNVENFLRSNFRKHCKQNYDDLSLVDLVNFSDVRGHLKSAEALISSGEYSKAMSEMGIAKTLLFSRLRHFVPHVDRHQTDSLIRKIPELKGDSTIAYITTYIELLRETTLAALLRVPIQNYSFVRMLPDAIQMGDRWITTNTHTAMNNEDQCKRAISCLVDISIRMESIL
jgi:hypothetical protein